MKREGKNSASKETEKNDSKTYSNYSKGTETSSKHTNGTTSSKDTVPSESNLDNNNTSADTPAIKSSVPKEEPKKPGEVEKKWAMSENEMINYSKDVVKKLGFPWYEKGTKKNSGWYAPITIKVTMDIETIKERIEGATSSTCMGLNPEQYGIKGYFEKESKDVYKYYVFY